MGGLNQSVTFDFEMIRMVLTQHIKRCIMDAVLVSIAFLRAGRQYRHFNNAHRHRGECYGKRECCCVSVWAWIKP